jgi:hypothetical protein
MQRVGAYGLALLGLEDQRQALAPAAAEWPQLRVCVEPGEPTEHEPSIDHAHAVYGDPTGGYAVIDRISATIKFVSPRSLASDELVHPRLGMAAAVYAHWLGRDAFHAGAFVERGMAWALVGEGNSGKSSLLAALAGVGAPVLTDDTLVVEEGLCLSGPRCLDLRVDVPGVLGLSNHVVSVRRGLRRRLPLDQPPGPIPLAGWVFLEWGDELTLNPVPPTERLGRIARQRGWHRRGAGDPQRLLELAALPAWELRRPMDWSKIGETVRLLLAAVSEPGLLEQQGGAGLRRSRPPLGS